MTDTSCGAIREARGAVKWQRRVGPESELEATRLILGVIRPQFINVPSRSRPLTVSDRLSPIQMFSAPPTEWQVLFLLPPSLHHHLCLSLPSYWGTSRISILGNLSTVPEGRGCILPIEFSFGFNQVAPSTRVVISLSMDSWKTLMIVSILNREHTHIGM